MGLFRSFIAQTRKPEGFLGRLMVGGMNGGGHAKLADWGMSHLGGITPANIAELGCGGGRNAAELLKRYPNATLTALDYSETSVKKTAETNRKEIALGRCAVVRGSVDALPFSAETFDLATAFETVYFWPDIERNFAEVRRVLTMGGRFLIVNEDDGLTGNNEKWEKIIDGMHTYTPDELRLHLTAAGFKEITIKQESAKHWLAVTAVK
jgi:ubiquinone/menaquinone biosynthesis C-methylase UbiE